MIQFSHTYKVYSNGTRALRDITFDVAKGEFVFITGPSGAGKTTLFKLMSAFDRATSGTVTVADCNLNELSFSDLPYFRRKIGVVYQDFRLLYDRSVFENVALPLEIRGDRGSYVSRRVDEVLELVGLIYKKDILPRALSGGEQQRVAIARALVHHPGVLIADEPTGNLDPELSQGILDLFENVNAQGTTVFVATHDMSLVKRRPRRHLRIHEGEVQDVVGGADHSVEVSGL